MVRALDVQQVLLQSSAVERVQQVQQHQADVQQNHFEGQLAEDKRALREKPESRIKRTLFVLYFQSTTVLSSCHLIGLSGLFTVDCIQL